METIRYPSAKEFGKLPIRVTVEEKVPRLQWEEPLNMGGAWVMPVPLEVQEVACIGVATVCNAHAICQMIRLYEICT